MRILFVALLSVRALGLPCVAPAELEVEVRSDVVILSGTLPEEEHLVSCDVPGYEPVDLSLTAGTTLPVRIDLSPIRHHVALRGVEKPIVVDWFRVEGGVHKLIASRVWEPEERLPVGEGGRVVRLRSSTDEVFSFIPIAAMEEVTVHWSEADLVVVLQNSIRAEKVVVNGRELPVVLSSGFDGVTAPMTKRSRIRPIYQGGIEGREIILEDRGPQAWLSDEAFDPVGGAEVVMDASLCTATRGLALRVRDTSLITPQEGHLVPLGEGCSVVVDGLAAGPYRFEVKSGSRTLGRGDGMIVAELRANVALERSAVSVDGSVRAGDGKPLSNVLVVVDDEIVATAADGSFQMDLPEGGETEFVLFEPVRLLIGKFVRDLTEGLNQVEFSIDGSILIIEITSEEELQNGEAIEISVSGTDGFSRRGFTFPSAESHSSRIFGVPKGSYQVFAKQGERHSETRDVLVSSSEERIHLHLQRSSGLLTVLDEHNEPLSGSVRGGAAILVPEASGVYSLASVGQGEEILVSAPGYMPTCRFYRGGDLTVQLQKPVHTASFHLGSGNLVNLLFIAGGPEGACEMPISLFSTRMSGNVLTVELEPGWYQLLIAGTSSLAFEVPGEIVRVDVE